MADGVAMSDLLLSSLMLLLLYTLLRGVAMGTDREAWTDADEGLAVHGNPSVQLDCALVFLIVRACCLLVVGVAFDEGVLQGEGEDAVELGGICQKCVEEVMVVVDEEEGGEPAEAGAGCCPA